MVLCNRGPPLRKIPPIQSPRPPHVANPGTRTLIDAKPPLRPKHVWSIRSLPQVPMVQGFDDMNFPRARRSFRASFECVKNSEPPKQRSLGPPPALRRSNPRRENGFRLKETRQVRVSKTPCSYTPLIRA